MLSSNHPYHALMNSLLERLDYIRIQPRQILNYGIHAYSTSHALSQRYPASVVIDLHDIDAVKKLSDGSVDFVFAHFPLVVEDPILVLREFHRVLSDGGLLLFTTLGPDTFFELRESFAAVDSFSHVYDFVDMHHVGDWLKSLYFGDPVVDRELITIFYQNIALFFSDLRELNLARLHQRGLRGLLSRNRWAKMLLHYDQLKVENEYPVTIECIFGHAWKMKKKQSDEFVVSVDQIRRKQ